MYSAIPSSTHSERGSVIFSRRDASLAGSSCSRQYRAGADSRYHHHSSSSLGRLEAKSEPQEAHSA
jgi:hypothetical protein